MSSPSLILIASEQLWPNLHGLLHWSHEGGGLDVIHILHTDNEKASALPARRLHALLQQAKGTAFRYRDLAPMRLVGTQPQDVSAVVAELIASAPDSQWVVVANGGLKTMTLGLLKAMGNPRVSVVYSEIGAGWQRVSFEADHVLTQPLPEIGAADMDLLPVNSLVEAQHVSDPGGVQLEISQVEALDIAGIARDCMTKETGWNWQRGFKRCHPPINASSGILFERWCGALLLEMGVKNLIGGLKLKGPGTADAAESDLLCIHKGRFYYLELKLIDEEAQERETFVEIARKACANCVAFGGASGIPFLLLPNWRLDDSQRGLIPLFHPQPLVLDACDSGGLISWLAERLRIQALPPALAALEVEIQNWMKEKKLTRVFGREARAIRYAGRDPVSVSIETFAASIRAEREQNWVILDHGGDVVLSTETIPNTSPPAGWKRRGQSWWISHPASSGLRAALRQYFGGYVNQRVPVLDLQGAWDSAHATLLTTPADHARPVLGTHREARPRRPVAGGGRQTRRVTGRLLTVGGRSAVYEAITQHGETVMVYIPTRLGCDPPAQTLEIELLGSPQPGVYQGRPVDGSLPNTT